MLSENEKAELNEERDFLGIPEVSEETKDFTLWPENVPVFILFSKLQTQWKYGAMGNLTGLDYPSVISVIKLKEKKRKRQLKIFEDIQLIEKGFISAVSQ